MTEYVFILTYGCTSWRSTFQKCIFFSSIEAEYVATSQSTKEIILLNNLLTNTGLLQQRVNLHCDSQMSIFIVLHLAENQVMDSRVKHINIKYHFMR